MRSFLTWLLALFGLVALAVALLGIAAEVQDAMCQKMVVPMPPLWPAGAIEQKKGGKIEQDAGGDRKADVRR